MKDFGFVEKQFMKWNEFQKELLSQVESHLQEYSRRSGTGMQVNELVSLLGIKKSQINKGRRNFYRKNTSQQDFIISIVRIIDEESEKSNTIVFEVDGTRFEIWNEIQALCRFYRNIKRTYRQFQKEMQRQDLLYNGPEIFV